MTRLKRRKNPNELSVTEHMQDFRRRLVVSILTLLLAFAGSFMFSATVLDTLLELGKSCGYSFIFLTPQEALMQHISIAISIGITVAAPVIIYELLAFILPAVSIKHGKLKALLSIAFAYLMFCVGAGFAYFMLVPTSLNFLRGVSLQHNVARSIDVGNFVSFTISLVTCLGIVFETPLVCIVITHFGLLSVKQLRKAIPCVTVLILVLAAVITPPDVMSQILVAIPMLALYIFSVILCGIINLTHRRCSKCE